MFDFIMDNAPLIILILAVLLVLAIVIFVAVIVKKNNKWREKEFESNRDAEMLKVRIGELEKEAAELHDHEAQLLSERDNILTAAHEKADDILEQTMTRVQKSEAQIRQNRIIASCTITDARRRISDLMIEVSKRLVIDDGMVLDVEQITPEAVKKAEAIEQASAVDFDKLVDSYTTHGNEPVGALEAKKAEEPE
ncbi:MAG: hypothetical protein J5998_12875, partial [Clostridia bacterium]|nr:hypothetical protein [Clostridia bacterium]